MDQIYKLNQELFNLKNLKISKHSDISDNSLPDITFLLSLPPSETQKRAMLRNGNNKFDLKPLSFYEKVNDNFEKIYNNNRKRIKKINCLNKKPLTIHQEIIRHVRQNYIINDENNN